MSARQTDWAMGLLLGGQSGRMGSDKAFLPFGDQTLIEFVHERCRSGSQGQILAVGATERPVPAALLDLPRVLDRVPQAGPLAGIEALLSCCQAPWLVVIPCDMPGLDTALLKHLVDTLARQGGQCGYFFHDQRSHRLPMALDRRAALAILPAILDRGGRRLKDLSEVLIKIEVPAPVIWASHEPASYLRNLNSPGDYQAALKDFVLPS